MAEKTKSLLDGPAGGALAEGAARLERLIQSVKAQQAQADQRPAAPVRNPLLVVSPEEEWSRHYQSLGIGHEGRGLTLSDLAPLPRAMIMPEPELGKPVIPGPAMDVVAKAPAAAIGEGLPQAVRPRRSWLGRLLRS